MLWTRLSCISHWINEVSSKVPHVWFHFLIVDTMSLNLNEVLVNTIWKLNIVLEILVAFGSASKTNLSEMLFFSLHLNIMF